MDVGWNMDVGWYQIGQNMQGSKWWHSTPGSMERPAMINTHWVLSPLLDSLNGLNWDQIGWKAKSQMSVRQMVGLYPWIHGEGCDEYHPLSSSIGLNWEQNHQCHPNLRQMVRLYPWRREGSIRWVIQPPLLSWDNNRHAGSDNPQLGPTPPQLKRKIYKAPY